MLHHAFAILEGEQEFVVFFIEHSFPLVVSPLPFMQFVLFVQFNRVHAHLPEGLQLVQEVKWKKRTKLQLPKSTLILNMRGLFEENPFMKNCGITLLIGKNETMGRQSFFKKTSSAIYLKT